MAAPQHILIVEDNDALRESLAEVLRGHGLQVTAVDCAEDLAERPPVRHDIAILDLNLPGEDGLSLATRLRRAQPGMGIILLTVRNAVADRLAGYDSGADLYLPKPIDPEELLAALDALRRRLRPEGAGIPTLDWAAAALWTEHGALTLRDTEARLLHALAVAPDQRLESWQLLELLEKPLDEQGRRQLAVIIARLRAKLEGHGLPPPGLRAERGVGYRLTFELQLK